jgi:large subunit ribosomal protein L6
MSRLGSRAVPVPKGVNVNLSEGNIAIKGPKGELSQKILASTSVSYDNDKIVVTRANDSRPVKAYHGLMRMLIANMVTGVSQGFTKNLELIGVGYKAEVRGKILLLNLGFSHPINYAFPTGISISVKQNPKSTVITVSGIDKEKVGQAAADIRSYRPPDSYKGKGVRYQGEIIRLKAGKQ